MVFNKTYEYFFKLKEGRFFTASQFLNLLLLLTTSLIFLNLSEWRISCQYFCDLLGFRETMSLVLISNRYSENKVNFLPSYNVSNLIMMHSFSLSYNIYTKIVSNRLHNTLSFAMDHIQAQTEVMKSRTEEGELPKALAFNDFEKAFDSIYPRAISESLANI